MPTQSCELILHATYEGIWLRNVLVSLVLSTGVGNHGGMSRSRDLDARLIDLVALMDATTPEDLHHVLVLGPIGAYEREVSMPLSYFRNAHAQDSERAVETAMLLVTDPRWRVAAGPLIEAIDATGIVPPNELDLLAESFVRADAEVYWECPSEWFSTIGISISRSASLTGSFDSDSDGSPGSTPDRDPDESRPTIAARVVNPGIRRWGSARVVRLEPTVWADVFARATELGGEAGGALMRGILDSIDVLPLKARTLVLEKTLKASRSEVRHAALVQIAGTDWIKAKRLGMCDANERVRRWASGLSDPTDVPTPKVNTVSTSNNLPNTSQTTQASLFD